MKTPNLYVTTMITLIGVALISGTLAMADGPKEPPVIPQLPPGWTMDDMKACIAAGTPGKTQEHLAKGVGTWQGKNTMWMAPGAPPVVTPCSSTVSSIMDGRYVRVETRGEMPGMGQYT